MQVRLITPNTPQFRALSSKELEERSAERKKLAAPLTDEKRAAARIRSENARNAGLANAAKIRAEKGLPTIAQLKQLAAKRRWKKEYKPRTNGIL